MLAVLGLPVYLFHLLPASLQLICMSVVAHLASVVGETAENFTNECRERSSEDSQVQPVRARRNRQAELSQAHIVDVPSWCTRQNYLIQDKNIQKKCYLMPHQRGLKYGYQVPDRSIVMSQRNNIFCQMILWLEIQILSFVILSNFLYSFSVMIFNL